MENKIENLQQYVKICAYNVHGIFNKINYPYFFNFFNDLDIFCCLETHLFKSTEQTQLTKCFPNHNLYWDPAIRTAVKGRGVGGLLIGWKKDFSKRLNMDLKVVSEENFTMVVLEKQNFLLNILPMYIRSEGWENSFIQLKSFINNGNKDFLLLGDFNARIGELQQTYVTEIHCHPNLLYPRKSKDKIINRRGRLFMELCLDQNLWLLNGACYGDEEGSITYSSTLGDSVIDLAAISNLCLGKVESFKVKDTCWSDHFPIVLKLRNNKMDPAMTELKLLPKLKWKTNQQESYCRKVQNLLSDEVNTLQQLCEVVKNSATIENNTNKLNPKQRWFDRECSRARILTLAKLRS
jgi:hypothetical protein